MSLQAQFEQAQADSKNLPERPDNMTLLKIYGLFKQASVGDATGDLHQRLVGEAWLAGAHAMSRHG